jgi:hypothetical protein
LPYDVARSGSCSGRVAPKRGLYSHFDFEPLRRDAWLMYLPMKTVAALLSLQCRQTSYDVVMKTTL